MKKVLIPTDFSKNADHAVDYALNLYRCERTHFYFLHAYADQAYELGKSKSKSEMDSIGKALHDQTTAALEKTVERITDPLPNPRHHYEVVAVFDALVDAINDLVEHENIDLVIMGTQGATGSKNVSVGSNTVQVFKYVKCPVLAIPEGYVYHEPKNILFPTDYQLPFKRRELKLLDDMAGFFKSKIHCIYFTKFDTLSHRQSDNKLFLEKSLSRAYLSFGQEDDVNVLDGIAKYRANNEVDMIVIINSRNSFLENMLFRTTVDKMGLRTDIPLLVMQNVYR
ncbi:universal stress protein [Flagellimonas allohymeniacidonis]|uniref:Universal stress protein n=1 Tax=Flagellimonas allohymeniacidonis TaxID=2517819 RepID=A0A4Q8QIB5_9FLAO|nr:universal stress protein [Allomuricauda hymeniacidonis]TAI49744.1 universal stress protein [Allomuricauda hymeniacidonis]